MLDMGELRKEVIGTNTFITTPFGRRLFTYADYTASGRNLRCIENYLLKIEEVYGNTHSEDSFSGITMTHLLDKAEEKIKDILNAKDNYLISVGTGTTGAILKLSEILGLYLTPGLKFNIDKLLPNDNRYHELIVDMFTKIGENRPLIFITPYEHHSNYLMWKESFAEIIETKLDENGFLDIKHIETLLSKPEYKERLKIGSFSAASNVTGIKTDLYVVARLFHKYNALIFLDFAASGPYERIDMNHDNESYFDAIFLSPHKFLGGPGSSGLLVINKRLYNDSLPPTVAGGGTVLYVNSFFHHYLTDVEKREKAGTPGILQTIKASLALQFKEYIGVDYIKKIEKEYLILAFNNLLNKDNIHIYGPYDVNKRISIISFNIKYKDKYLHHKFVARLLNDLFGIQARSGCACAGPYAHFLLDIDDNLARKFAEAINQGLSGLRPGFVRINLHYLMAIEEVEYIINSIIFISQYGYLFLNFYEFDLKTGNFNHISYIDNNEFVTNFSIEECLNSKEDSRFNNITVDKKALYKYYLFFAYSLVKELTEPKISIIPDKRYAHLQWFPYLHLKKEDK